MVYRIVPKSILFIFLFLIVGCTPKYKIVYEYISPANSMGKICINRCYLDKKNCEVNCAQKYNICSINAQNIARQNYNVNLMEYHRLMHIWEIEQVQYDALYSRYIEDKNLYQDEHKHYKKLCEKDQNNHHACKKKKFYKNKLNSLNYPFSPTKPYQPSLANEIKKAKKDLCTDNCGCKDRFNSCFSSCGGKVISKKICVENCR